MLAMFYFVRMNLFSWFFFQLFDCGIFIPGIELIKFKTGEKVDYDEDISCLSDVEIFKINEFAKKPQDCKNRNGDDGNDLQRFFHDTKFRSLYVEFMY